MSRCADAGIFLVFFLFFGVFVFREGYCFYILLLGLGGEFRLVSFEFMGILWSWVLYWVLFLKCIFIKVWVVFYFVIYFWVSRFVFRSFNFILYLLGVMKFVWGFVVYRVVLRGCGLIVCGCGCSV